MEPCSTHRKCMRVGSGGREWGRHKWRWSKNAKNGLAIVQFSEGSVRGRLWPGKNTYTHHTSHNNQPTCASVCSNTGARIDRWLSLCCMAVFLVGEVLCLVNSVDERDPGLLSGVMYDSYLPTS